MHTFNLAVKAPWNIFLGANSSYLKRRPFEIIGTDRYLDLTTPTAISDVFALSLPQSFSINLASGVKIYTPARRTPRRARGKHATIRDVVFEEGLFFWAFMDKPSLSMPYHQDNWAGSSRGRGNAASRDPYQGLTRSTTIPHPDDPGFAPFAPYPAYPGGYDTATRSSNYGSVDDRLSPETRAGEFLSSLSPPRRENWPSSRAPKDVAMTGSRDYPASAISSQDGNPPQYCSSGSLESPDWGTSNLSGISSSFQSPYSPSSSIASYESIRSAPGLATGHSQADPNMHPQTLASTYPWETSYQFSQAVLDPTEQRSSSRGTVTVHGSKGDKRRSKTYRGGRDEFEGSIQFLEKPRRPAPEHREQDLPLLPIHLDQGEQDSVLSQVNRRLSQCAFDWVAEYRFPIPLEPNKPAVQTASDKEWTEWNYLIKRLATKRKIPTHAVYNGQIKELTTVLDNALEMRHTTKPQARPLKDDRHVLQFISAGIQVGKMLKDATTMEYLDKLYKQTEKVIHERATTPPYAR